MEPADIPNLFKNFGDNTHTHTLLIHLRRLPLYQDFNHAIMLNISGFNTYASWELCMPRSYSVMIVRLGFVEFHAGFRVCFFFFFGGGGSHETKYNPIFKLFRGFDITPTDFV